MTEKLANKTNIDPLAERANLLIDIENKEEADRTNPTFQNLKELVALYKRLVQQDPVTGLVNLAGALEHGSTELSAGHRVLVFSVNISGFKEVNSTHSHAVGDSLLSKYAYIIANSFRSGNGRDNVDMDCVGARSHGDQFVIVVSTDNSSQEVIDVILKRITNIFDLNIDHSNFGFSKTYEEIDKIVNPPLGNKEGSLESSIKLSYRVGFSDSQTNVDKAKSARELFRDSEHSMLSEEDLLSIEASHRVLSISDVIPITINGLKQVASANWTEIKKLEKVVYSSSFGRDPSDAIVARRLLELYKKDVGINSQTGLSNRHKFIEHIAEKEEQTKNYALGMIDLKLFGKWLNEFYGKDIGNLYLESFAELIFSFAQQNPIQINGQIIDIKVARTGGDEFHWISGELPDYITLESITEAFNKHFIERIESILQDWCDKNHIAS